MGQNINPTIFRAKPSTLETTLRSSFSAIKSTDLQQQEGEIRNFLSFLLKSSGILIRKEQHIRDFSFLTVSLDLYFSHFFSGKMKYLWAQRLYKSFKKKYTWLKRINDVQRIVQTLENSKYSKEQTEGSSTSVDTTTTTHSLFYALKVSPSDVLALKRRNEKKIQKLKILLFDLFQVSVKKKYKLSPKTHILLENLRLNGGDSAALPRQLLRKEEEVKPPLNRFKKKARFTSKVKAFSRFYLAYRKSSYGTRKTPFFRLGFLQRSLKYRQKLLFVLSSRSNALLKRKKKLKLFSVTSTSIQSPFLRLKLKKLNKFFFVSRKKINLRQLHMSFFLFFRGGEKKTLNDLNVFLTRSLQRYLGIDSVTLIFFSTQLVLMPSYLEYRERIQKSLFKFKNNRALINYFYEFIECCYFVCISFGQGNASLLAHYVRFLLENLKNQVLVVRFLSKSLKRILSVLKKKNKSLICINGIKVLIKGRFNKRRRTRKMKVEQGSLSIQSVNTPLDYYQALAVTIYGSFGIKIWISKGKNAV